MLSVRYWTTLALHGEWNVWPGTVSFPDTAPSDTDVREQLLPYSFARPEVQFHAGPVAESGLSLLAGEKGPPRGAGPGPLDPGRSARRSPPRPATSPTRTE